MIAVIGTSDGVYAQALEQPDGRVPARHFWMVGDAVHSCDSRIFGLVPAELIEGVIVAVPRARRNLSARSISDGDGA